MLGHLGVADLHKAAQRCRGLKTRSILITWSMLRALQVTGHQSSSCTLELKAFLTPRAA